MAGVDTTSPASTRTAANVRINPSSSGWWWNCRTNLRSRGYVPVTWRPGKTNSVDERPQQRPALSVERLGTAQVVQVAREVPDQQAAVREGARPVVQPGLERARALPRLDPPVPDLDLLFDLQHPRHFEDKARHGERRLQRLARIRIEIRRIADERELLLLAVPQREVRERLRPGK